MPLGTDLTQDIRVGQKEIVDLLNNLRRLLGGSTDNRNVGARVQNANGNAAHGDQPGLSVATALDNHLLLGIAELPGDQPLGILELDALIIHDEGIQMGTPVQNLFCPRIYVTYLTGQLM